MVNIPYRLEKPSWIGAEWISDFATIHSMSSKSSHSNSSQSKKKWPTDPLHDSAWNAKLQW
jgi:hypothetical protein